MAVKKITEVTRRDIREALSSFNLYGRLDEMKFLDRLYNLDALPSTDSRFRTARDDIRQHRIANDDWANDWIFDDDRLGLNSGDDHVLLRFLSDMLHPIVRSDQDEVTRLLDALNALLGPDGYRLVQRDQLSGRPIFAAVEIPPVPPSPRTDSAHFTKDVRPLVSTVARLAELDGSSLEREVLRLSRPRLEEPERDNWNGGTYYYTLTLVAPVALFARLGDQVPTLEKRIAARIAGVQRSRDNHQLTSVVIVPSVSAHDDDQLASVVAARSQRLIPQFWAPGHFRLFISHVTPFKQRATALRQALTRYCVSGFVAHEIIAPGELWQGEIEAALRSMHAMVALVTPEFHDSVWTNQEVGWALGTGVETVSVRREADPRGFLSQVQGIQGAGKSVAQVADALFKVLLRRPTTKAAMLEALVAGFEASQTHPETRETLGLLEQAAGIPEALLSRIEAAARTNSWIKDSEGVPQRVVSLLRALRSTTLLSTESGTSME